MRWCFMIETLLDLASNLFNAPLLPLLSFIKDMLTEPVNLSLFSSIWAIIIYIISISYGLLFIWSGFNFMISGHSVEKRIKAKNWLKNILIMIILIQSSYFFYELLINFNTLLSFIFSDINQN